MLTFGSISEPSKYSLKSYHLWNVFVSNQLSIQKKMLKDFKV